MAVTPDENRRKLRDLPVSFEDSVARIKTGPLARDIEGGAEVSLVPDDLAMDLMTQEILKQDIPCETFSRQGRQVEFNEAGGIVMGPYVDQSQYELDHVLGRGGMGLVCAARQNSLRRVVAIKIARKTDAKEPTSRSLEGFTNEAFVTASLEHPNVVPVYTLSKDSSGRVFFTMKRVTGMPWDSLLDPSRVKDPEQRQRAKAMASGLTWDDHLDVLMKMADAVAFAHSKGLIHRDLKPENVMIGDYGEVLLMDWGLAMAFGDQNPYHIDPTKAPHLAGTPGYLAPEMARGQMTRFGPATDVYLLGGILYRLLTGRSPHYSQDIMTSVAMAARGQVEPLDGIESSSLDPEIARITMKALAPRIDDRYPTVLAFQADLKTYRANGKSLAISSRAHESLEKILGRLGSRERLSKEEAALAYGHLSEAIGAFRQALLLWEANGQARRGLHRAWMLQIELALDQGDLTLAKSYIDQLGTLGGEEDDVNRRNELVSRLEQLQRRQALQDRRGTLLRWLVAIIILLVVTGVAGAFGLIHRQKRMAQESLFATREMQRQMFAQAVVGRAGLVGQYMKGIEQVVAQYRGEAERLLALGPGELPIRPVTAVGREGFYLDEDYYNEGTRPPGMGESEKYGFSVSMSQSTAVLAPWAQAGPAREAALEDVRRLSWLSHPFAHVHQSRSDLLWSLTATARGSLVSFPGSGRFREKTSYDPTTRLWYQGAIDSPDGAPRWMEPHIDAAGQGLIICCASAVRQGGRNVGVIGVELSLRTIQEMLTEFTRAAGANAHGLLVGQDGKVIIDTRYEAGSTGWKEKFRLNTMETASRELGEYYRAIVSHQGDGLRAKEVLTADGPRLFSHAKLAHPSWLLVVEMDSQGLDRR